MDFEIKWLSYFFSSNFIEAIFSEKENKKSSSATKIVIKIIKENVYQLSFMFDKKVKHENVNTNKLCSRLQEIIKDYRQFLIRLTNKEYHIIKRGNKFKIIDKDVYITKNNTLTHDRDKQYILKPLMKLDFLVAQGVMTNDYQVKANMQHKFRQINRFLEFIRDIENELPTDRPIEIVDFGCGKSYLTFAIYYYFVHILKRKVHIFGLDLKDEVIDNCNKLKDDLGYSDLMFKKGDIADYNSDKPIDLLVTLHACDTATDYALYHGIRLKTKVILSVPCCQHELHFQMHDTPLDSIFKFGIIQERTAALLTDGLRALLLESCGYKTQILEFIDLEHTPKNLLIRAVLTNKTKNKWSEVEDLIKNYHINPTLYKLLKDERND